MVRASRPTAGLLACLMAMTACSGTPSAPVTERESDVVTQPIVPSFVHGTDNGDTDRLAATVVTDVQKYWAKAFPATFGTSWRDLDGGFFSVDTAAAGGKPPPCAATTAEVEGNAFYCASVDAIAWDRAALLPVLREHYGAAAVVVVLAHEIGHAVQQRTGIDISGADHTHIEAMADCYAGSFVRSAADGGSEHVHINPAQLDDAMRALIVFRDPIGTAQSSSNAHGTAFDRVSSFQDGYRDGPRRCTDPTARNRRPTVPDSPAQPDRRPLDDVVRTGSADMQAYFGSLAARRHGRWASPIVVPSTDPAARCARGARAPVAYCAVPPAVVFDVAELAASHRDVGDQSSVPLLASRYALAALSALGRPITGADAGRRATCLAGAYASSRAGAPGALDEAVDALLTGDSASRDAEGGNAITGFDRVAAFRIGAKDGANACL
jgi:predicted metalloprotease